MEPAKKNTAEDSISAVIRRTLLQLGTSARPLCVAVAGRKRGRGKGEGGEKDKFEQKNSKNVISNLI